MSYYLKSEVFLTVMSDFVFNVRKLHVGIASLFVEVEYTDEVLIESVRTFVYCYLKDQPNSMRFYSSRVKDSNKPGINSEINDKFINELVDKLMERFTKLDEVHSKIALLKEHKEKQRKSQDVFASLSEEEKMERFHKAVVKSEDYWASRGHSVN